MFQDYIVHEQSWWTSQHVARWYKWWWISKNMDKHGKFSTDHENSSSRSHCFQTDCDLFRPRLGGFPVKCRNGRHVWQLASSMVHWSSIDPLGVVKYGKILQKKCFRQFLVFHFWGVLKKMFPGFPDSSWAGHPFLLAVIAEKGWFWGTLEVIQNRLGFDSTSIERELDSF